MAIFLLVIGLGLAAAGVAVLIAASGGPLPAEAAPSVISIIVVGCTLLGV